MNKICTSKEQSRRLVELGVDVNTADMWYNITFKGDGYDELPSLIQASDMDIPAWSLTSLLELMPLPMLSQHKNGKWQITSYPNGGVAKTLQEHNDPIDAAVEMVWWLTTLKNI